MENALKDWINMKQELPYSLLLSKEMYQQQKKNGTNWPAKDRREVFDPKELSKVQRWPVQTEDRAKVEPHQLAV